MEQAKQKRNCLAVGQYARIAPFFHLPAIGTILRVSVQPRSVPSSSHVDLLQPIKPVAANPPRPAKFLSTAGSPLPASMEARTDLLALTHKRFPLVLSQQ